LPKPKVSRKEARKQDREGKKRRKAEYFSSTTNNSKRVATSPHPESRPPKKKTVVEPPRPQSPDLKSQKDLSPRHGSSVLKPKGANVVASSSSTKNSPSRLVGYNFPRSRQEEEEDRYIALLEAKLTSGKKLKDGVGYLKDIEDDGLGGE
jgi:nucleolar MIF4G domain-containing protein 1